MKTANSRGPGHTPPSSGFHCRACKEALCRERSGWEGVGVFESPGVGVGVGRTLLQVTLGPKVVSS